MSYSRLYLTFSLLTLAACRSGEAPVAAAVSPPPGSADSSAQPPAAATMVEYTASIADVPEGGNCSLDLINGAAPGGNAAAGDSIIFGGWMADVNGQVPVDARLVLSSPTGSYAVPVKGGVERPDVAQALGQAGLAKSGFNITTRMIAPPSAYDLFILDGGATASACALKARLTVQ